MLLIDRVKKLYTDCQDIGMVNYILEWNEHSIFWESLPIKNVFIIFIKSKPTTIMLKSKLAFIVIP